MLSMGSQPLTIYRLTYHILIIAYAPLSPILAYKMTVSYFPSRRWPWVSRCSRAIQSIQILSSLKLLLIAIRLHRLSRPTTMAPSKYFLILAPRSEHQHWLAMLVAMRSEE